MKTLILSLFILANFSTHLMAREIIIDGFFLDLEDFNNDYRSTSTYDEIAAEEYITKINRNARTDAREIAENITLAAQCAQVDAIYLLAKIHQESTFYISANSSTGAAGLSQMTGVAIQEVKDQLGIRGSRYARSSVIRSLRNDLKNCLGISAYNELYALYRDKTKYQIKQVYKRDIKQSILAGAIILKIFLTKNYSPNRSLRENYRRALEDYNGESTRAQYAQSIIDKASLIRARFNN